MIAVWTRAVVVVAVVKATAGLAAYVTPLPVVSQSAEYAFPAWINILHVVIFGVVAGLLLVAGGRDSRARHLGGLFMLVAAMFADRSLRLYAEASGGATVDAIASLHPYSFTPAFWWLFVSVFPARTSENAASVVTPVAIRLSMTVGGLLFVANVLPIVVSIDDASTIPAW